MSIDKKVIEKAVQHLKPEIEKEMYKVLEDALTKINVNIPELHYDRDAAIAIYNAMSQAMESIKKDIEEGKYDQY